MALIFYNIFANGIYIKKKQKEVSHLDIGNLEKFTIIMYTDHKESKCFQSSIRHYTNIPLVDKFIVIWNKKARFPNRSQLLKMGVNRSVPVEFYSSKNVTSRRFSKEFDISTNAILSLDYDVEFSKDDIYRLFDEWKVKYFFIHCS